MTAPVFPYTPALRAGDWLVISGQLGMKDGALVGVDLASQTQQQPCTVLGQQAVEKLARPGSSSGFNGRRHGQRLTTACLVQKLICALAQVKAASRS